MMNTKTWLTVILLVAAFLSLGWNLKLTLIDPWQKEQYAWGDFGAYYMSGYSILQGLQIYDHSEVCRHARQMGSKKVGVPRFGYPPFTALLFIPLAALMDAVSAYRFCLVAYQVLLWVAVGLALLTVRARFSVIRLSLVVIAVSWFTPVWTTLDSGQINMVVLLLVALGLLAMSRAKPMISGMVLAVAGMIKLFPGLALFYFALRRRWSALTAIGITCALLLALGIAVAGWEPHRQYIEEEVPRNAGLIHGGNFNVALNSLVYRTIHNKRLTPKIAAASQVARRTTFWLRALLLLISGALIVWPREDGEQKAVARLALLVTTAMMVNAWTWTHHLVVALPCLAVAGRRLLGSATFSIIRPTSLLSLLAYGLMAIGYRVPIHEGIKMPLVRELLRSSSLNFYGLMLLWLLLAALIVRERSADV